VQPCTPPAVAVVEAVVIILSSMRAGLYALLQCVEDSEYGCKAYGHYFEVFHVLLAKDGESSLPASGNFQYAAA
jgi:glucosinolate gamma-glutamyl hydrolase